MKYLGIRKVPWDTMWHIMHTDNSVDCCSRCGATRDNWERCTQAEALRFAKTAEELGCMDMDIIHHALGDRPRMWSLLNVRFKCGDCGMDFETFQELGTHFKAAHADALKKAEEEGK